MAYSKEIKSAAIKMMLPPNSKPLSHIHDKTNIPVATLTKWREELRSNGHAAPGGEEQPEKWNSRDKFLIVVETIAMNEAELSEYCRQKGLFPEQVKQWQDVCQEANGGAASDLVEASRQQRAVEKELKVVRKELQRKESALAEAAALLVLSKKAEAIWGTHEEE